MGFQRTINDYQAPATAGDFASTNPYASILAGPGALVAPAGGLTVGNFAWVGPAGQVSQSYVAGYQIGFLGRNQQALITNFLGEDTMLVPEGFMVTLFNEGDFWAAFPAGATVGGYVFADPNTGTPLYSGTDSAPTLGTATAQAGFTGDGTLVIGTPNLTITTKTNGILSPGDAVSGTGIPSGTTILSQTSGNAGGVGVYVMSANATATESSPEAITGTSSYMFVTAVADGSLNFGDVFSGTDVAAGSSITGQATPFSGVATTTTSSTGLAVTSVQPGTDLLRPGATVVMQGVTPGTTISSQTSGTPGGVGVYVLSAAATTGYAGAPITTGDEPGQTGLYSITNGPQAFGAASASETITVAGTAQATGFRVRGTYSPGSGASPPIGNLAKISTN
jgi:hypothetical protein